VGAGVFHAAPVLCVKRPRHGVNQCRKVLSPGFIPSYPGGGAAFSEGEDEWLLKVDYERR
jgi:hypothetical protein